MELNEALLNTFIDANPISKGAIGEVGILDFGEGKYVYKRAPFVNGQENPEMTKEMLTMLMITSRGDYRIHVPHYIDGVDLEYNGIMYTFIVMTLVPNYIDVRILPISDFVIVLHDVLEQLMRISGTGVTSHNDLHTGNVLVSVPNIDIDYKLDDFRGAFTGMRAFIIDFGRASIKPEETKTRTPCTDLLAFAMSYMITKTGYLLNTEYRYILADVDNNMVNFYDTNGILSDNPLYRLAWICESIMLNCLGITHDNVLLIYNDIRTINFERHSTYTMSSTIPPYFFFADKHLTYINNVSLLRSDESTDNCRNILTNASSL